MPLNGLIKPLGIEMALTTANMVSNATCVRLYASANALITYNHVGYGITDPSLANTTFTMPAGSVEYVKKAPADTLAANVSVNATPVAFY